MSEINSEQLLDELVRLSGLLELATEELKTYAHDEARLENEYRKAKANSYLAASGTVNERTAHVDKICSHEREKYYLARASKEATLESVRSLRAQLSAYQSICASFRSEAELAGKGNYR
jgi:predicted nuclease with TOPRIM domain